ncbi:hypothetical protein IWW34DRAFT_804339 [Fusarium oxysporum f. sp. albedinis]|nr:hypothetical protein IWW34DRAFT_804339 [Fusarium oxysporum f. sp. albedinis]
MSTSYVGNYLPSKGSSAAAGSIPSEPILVLGTRRSLASWITAVDVTDLVHMAVDIPELDQPGNKGLLRTSWFPLVLSQEAPFQTILLLSAANMSSVSGTSISPGYILQLRLQAISAINALMVTNDDMSDALIGAVAKMASFEAMHGGVEAYRIHMQGLYDMVEQRHGLNVLGLNGLLRRIIIWIDINSSFLLQIPRRFPGEYFTNRGGSVEPNLERFIAP